MTTFSLSKRKRMEIMEARPNEIQAGLRILARMIAEAYLKDLARRNAAQFNKDNQIDKGVNNEEEKAIKVKRKG